MSFTLYNITCNLVYLNTNVFQSFHVFLISLAQLPYKCIDRH